MDELDRFRDFRRGVAAPSDDARRRASARLGAAVQQRPQANVRFLTKRPGYSALALGALATAAAAALFVSSPWKDSPGFLERAQAALTPPPDTILHMKWVVISSVFTEPPCTVTHGPNEIWIDQVSPHRYRAILHDPPPAGADASVLSCASATMREVGGVVDPACSPAEQSNCTTLETLEFEPPNTLSESPLQFVLPPDPVTMLREAISAGNAHHEGRMQLDGRTVERIRIDSPSACAFPSCAFGHVLVDPETFHPVEMHALAQVDVVDRYLTFEYLPRTDANLALTDIRAQHPYAKGP